VQTIHQIKTTIFEITNKRFTCHRIFCII